MGEARDRPFQLSLNPASKVEFQGWRVTSDGGLILVRELDERLGLCEAGALRSPGEAERKVHAVRISSNDALERAVAELLRGPVGRPSHKPVVRYKSFRYQAERWRIARRVVAKIEFHCEELFSRVASP